MSIYYKSMTDVVEMCKVVGINLSTVGYHQLIMDVCEIYIQNELMLPVKIHSINTHSKGIVPVLITTDPKSFAFISL